MIFHYPSYGLRYLTITQHFCDLKIFQAQFTLLSNFVDGGGYYNYIIMVVIIIKINMSTAGPPSICVFGFAADSSSDVCGIPEVEPVWLSRGEPGGEPAVGHSWPWQVSFGYVTHYGDYRHFCGGSILSRYWIITAAHCL